MTAPIEEGCLHMPDMQRLQGRVCVITGAASALGKAVADRLASEGATVVGVDRRDHAVGDHPLRSELAEEEDVQQLFALVKRDFSRIDVL